MGLAGPDVSVLLPAKNAARTLERAVRSMLEQTWSDLEVVVVDDASTDQTFAVATALGGEDARVRIVRGPGAGIVAALNAGLRECRGRFIARMDADDESLPARIERSVAALEKDPSLAGVGTQVEIFRDGQPVSPNMQLYARWMNSMTTSEAVFRERFVESPLCHPSVTLRREVLEAVGGWAAGDFPEDYQLWLRLLERGHSLRAIPEVLFRWRDHDDRLTRSDPRYTAERFTATKAEFLVRGVLRARRCQIWGAGKTGLAIFRQLRTLGVDVSRLLEIDPDKIGQRIDGVPVESWEGLGGPAGEHLVAAVGAKGAREQIRRALVERGWVEGRDFTCVA